MKMNDSKKNDQLTDHRPTGLMGTQCALNIAQGVLDAMEEAEVTKVQMLSWGQKELRLLSKRAAQKFLGLVNKRKDSIWAEEKSKIEKFYKEYFGRTINWSLVSLPAKSDVFKKIEYIFADMTEDQILQAYAKKFGRDKMYLKWKSVTKAIKTQQDRPVGDRVFAHVGGLEPDLLNKSYDDGISLRIKFMVPKEGFIAAFRERTETGNMYDVVGLTRFAALDRSCDVMIMCRDNDGESFTVGSDQYYARDSYYGLRRVSFQPVNF